MSLRAGRRGKGPAVEVVPVDELPRGLPGPAARQKPGTRPAGARLGPGNPQAALGGRAKAEALRVSRMLGRTILSDDHSLTPYRRDASEWRDAHLANLAMTVGGGEVGPAVLAIVSTAALQHCASRYLFDRAMESESAKLMLEASKLANESRQNILASFELAAREALARKDTSTVGLSWEEQQRRAMKAIQDRIGGGGSQVSDGAPPAPEGGGGFSYDTTAEEIDDDEDDLEPDDDEPEAPAPAPAPVARFKSDGTPDPRGRFDAQGRRLDHLDLPQREPLDPFVNRFNRDGSRSMTGEYDERGRRLR